MVFYDYVVDDVIIDALIPYPDVLLRTGLVDQVGLTELGYIEHMEEPILPEITPEQIRYMIENQTQSRLDAFARTRGYDSIMSCCTYAISPNLQFKAEAEYCVDARDATWSTVYEIFADVDSEVRPLPVDFAEIEPELPVLVWPV